MYIIGIGGFQNSVAHDENIAVSQGIMQKTIHLLCQAICRWLGHKIRFPQIEEEKLQTKQKFHAKAGIPRILGMQKMELHDR